MIQYASQSIQRLIDRIWEEGFWSYKPTVIKHLLRLGREVFKKRIWVIYFRRRRMLPVVLDSESSQLPLFLFIAYLRCPTKRNSVTAKIKSYVAPDFVQQFA